MARRGENIYFRKDGRYEGRYMKGKNEKGKAIYGSVYAKKYKECKERLLRAKQDYKDIETTCKCYKNGSTREFLLYWLQEIARPTIKDSTFSNYDAITNKFLIPHLGTVSLSKLTLECIQQFVNMLSEQKLSAGTVHNIYRVLSVALKRAVQYGYAQNNPCLGVELPVYHQREVMVLSKLEQARLEAIVQDDPEGLPIFFALYTGLRVGEICALQWSNIDFESGVLRVSCTRKRIKSLSPNAKTKTQIIEGSAKTRSAMRVIPLLSILTTRLKAAMKYANSEYVFTSRGKPLEPRVLQYRLHRKLRQANLRSLHFHTLRHTFATRCLEQNMDVKTLSELLGHASATLTLNRYGHSQIEHKRAVMKNLEKAVIKTA